MGLLRMVRLHTWLYGLDGRCDRKPVTMQPNAFGICSVRMLSHSELDRNLYVDAAIATSTVSSTGPNNGSNRSHVIHSLWDHLSLWIDGCPESIELAKIPIDRIWRTFDNTCHNSLAMLFRVSTHFRAKTQRGSRDKCDVTIQSIQVAVDRFPYIIVTRPQLDDWGR